MAQGERGVWRADGSSGVGAVAMGEDEAVEGGVGSVEDEEFMGVGSVEGHQAAVGAAVAAVDIAAGSGDGGQVGGEGDGEGAAEGQGEDYGVGDEAGVEVEDGFAQGGEAVGGIDGVEMGGDNVGGRFRWRGLGAEGGDGEQWEQEQRDEFGSGHGGVAGQ